MVDEKPDTKTPGNESNPIVNEAKKTFHKVGEDLTNHGKEKIDAVEEKAYNAFLKKLYERLDQHLPSTGAPVESAAVSYDRGFWNWAKYLWDKPLVRYPVCGAAIIASVICASSLLHSGGGSSNSPEPGYYRVVKHSHMQTFETNNTGQEREGPIDLVLQDDNGKQYEITITNHSCANSYVLNNIFPALDDKDARLKLEEKPRNGEISVYKTKIAKITPSPNNLKYK